MANKLKIMSGPGVDDGGCGLYRIRQPFIKIFDQKLAQTNIAEKDDDANLLMSNVEEADVMVFRPRAELFWWKLLEFGKDPKVSKKYRLDEKTIVFDHDDNTFLTDPLNPHYASLGTEEAEITDFAGKYGPIGAKHKLWEDGKNGFDLKVNRGWRQSLERILTEADLVTTTTPVIAKYFSIYNKNVVVLPNCIDFNHWKFVDIVKDEWTRLVIQGGDSHYRDWITIKDALIEIMRKYPKTKLIVAGQKFDAVLDGLPKDRIETIPFIKVVGHPYRMATLNIDIAVIPLEDNEFNHCKSEIKFSEFSALKIPCVVKNIPPYSLVCEDGENALCYNNNRDLVKKLSILIEDKQLRTKLGNKAYEWVKNNRDADKCAHLWTDAYETCRNHKS